MKILDRHIRMHLTQGFVLVLLVLVSVFSFLDFVEELDDINLGNYDVIDAIIFVILTTRNAPCGWCRSARCWAVSSL